MSVAREGGDVVKVRVCGLNVAYGKETRQLVAAVLICGCRRKERITRRAWRDGVTGIVGGEDCREIAFRGLLLGDQITKMAVDVAIIGYWECRNDEMLSKSCVRQARRPSTLASLAGLIIFCVTFC